MRARGHDVVLRFGAGSDADLGPPTRRSKPPLNRQPPRGQNHNHFPRKEDMFFDLDEVGREILLEALWQRDPRISPVETLRLFAHRLVEEQSPSLNSMP